VGRADLYVSNLLAFLEDSEVEAVAKHIGVARKFDIEGKLNIDWLDIALKAASTKSKLKVKDSL
jgi:hypothetical protein